MIGVIDVGGGLRGVYGAGVFDYCMGKGIYFDYCIGISAGSANITSYLAGQQGRNFVFYTEYSFRKEYMGLEQKLKTGSFINLDYIYGTLSNSDGEYPLNYDAIAASSKPFYVVATDADTGRPVYFSKEDLGKDHYDIVKCSCCVPVFNKPYVFRGERYYDGGISDPIPVRKAFADGCDKVVVILTRPRDFYREPKGDIRLANILRHRYPAAARALAHRAKVYNHELNLCKKYEKAGKVLIVAPDSIGEMKTLTRDREAEISLYNKGLRDAKAIPGFLREKR